MSEKPIRVWRLVTPEQGPGLFVWFDPDTERLSLRDLTEDEKAVTLDSVPSVSGSIGSDQPEAADGCNGELDEVQLPFLFSVELRSSR